MSALPRAILLIGPTGAGKTPLGAYLERRGLFGRRCHHFDFGARLRRAAESPLAYPLLTPDDISIIEESLETGVLLEDHQFHIAEKLLRAFIGARAVSETEWLIMNGLPRHVGQAGRLEALVIVDLVVYLACADETVYRRILENSGGDRTGRRDDTQDAVARKLAIFGERTRPLLAYYESRRVPITTVGISRPTSPAEVVEKLVKGELTP